MKIINLTGQQIADTEVVSYVQPINEDVKRVLSAYRSTGAPRSARVLRQAARELCQLAVNAVHRNTDVLGNENVFVLISPAPHFARYLEQALHTCNERLMTAVYRVPQGTIPYLYIAET